MQKTILLILAISEILGCGSLPAQKEYSDHRPTTSSLGVIRTDGVYVCRGLKSIGSPGGLGFWPFESPATQLLSVEFLKFEASGKVSEMYASEPTTIDQACRYFREELGGQWAVEGKYTSNVGKVNFLLRGLTADRVSHSNTSYSGIVYTNYIAVESEGAGGAIYREYDFIKCSDITAASSKIENHSGKTFENQLGGPEK